MYQPVSGTWVWAISRSTAIFKKYLNNIAHSTRQTVPDLWLDKIYTDIIHVNA